MAQMELARVIRRLDLPEAADEAAQVLAALLAELERELASEPTVH
jgi:hypothetical protein